MNHQIRLDHVTMNKLKFLFSDLCSAIGKATGTRSQELQVRVPFEV